jgi:hypothetical protein
LSLIADSTYSAGAFPAAQFCADLSIGGHTDWYLPARFELDIAYFNLKPGTGANITSWGSNIYSVPKRDNNYTANYPQQTYVTAFNTSAEAFAADPHWSSTEGITTTTAWLVGLAIGTQVNSFKTTTNRRVRAFRKLAL